nr:EOG090X00QS [Triops cancriformis]
MTNGSCQSSLPTLVPVTTTLMPVPDVPVTPPCVLTVQVVPKEIQLPEDSTSISAFVIPSPAEGQTYTYRWTPVQLAKENVGTMTNTDTPTLKLTELAEGTYVFRVTVTSDVCAGETLANLTVLPAKRLNQPPQPVIRPTQVHVRLPTNMAIFDGSLSTDDTGIASYEWELQQGPIGFQAVLQAGPTLELKRLIPGNYTVKLVLTDVDGIKNWTTAYLTVVSRTDYPPQANAGPDVIVYLPQNSIVLNGSLSADDRGIASYEWTRLAGVQGGAVDMENTHTPLLQLSLLQEGMYTFQLKVTDTSGQTDTDEVNVFVREPQNKLPVANAGEDREIALPTTWVVLNGSLSTDVLTVNKWKWSQQKGPKLAQLVTLSPDSVNATALTVGNYTFLLEVCDEGGACSNDTVDIKVIQRENEKPKANAGGERSVTLPVTLAILNGSQSTDDLGILTDLVPGHYYFRLRVTDMQGASDEDVASLLVHPDPRQLDMVLLIMNSDIHMFKEHERIKLGEQLGLLLHYEGPITVQMDKIVPDSKSS